MHDIVTYNEVGNNLICQFNGNLDTIVSQVIADELFNHIQEAGKFVIFDLKNVDYISSGFLRISLSSARAVPGMKIKIINAIPDIQTIYKTAGLGKVFIFE